MGLFDELARRNVIRGAIAYAAVGWLIIEVGSVLLPAFAAPEWMLRALIIVALAGFLPAVILACFAVGRAAVRLFLLRCSQLALLSLAGISTVTSSASILAVTSLS